VIITRLPRVGAQPAYRIFGCSVCGYVEWAAQPAKD